VIKKLYHLKGKAVTIHCFNEERGGIKKIYEKNKGQEERGRRIMT
jgi:hypothetical protein